MGLVAEMLGCFEEYLPLRQQELTPTPVDMIAIISATKGGDRKENGDVYGKEDESRAEEIEVEQVSRDGGAGYVAEHPKPLVKSWP